MKYSGNFAKEISFPIGGIGTGCIGLDGDGRLIDWEIFNRPSKGGASNGYSHFSIRAIDNDTIIPMVMNGDIKKDYIGHHSGYGHGPDTTKMFGHPHFRNVEFNGEFPVAEVDFKDDKFPADIKMTAFNPFIPIDAKNSSIPGAFFEITVTNTADTQMTYQVALSASNPYEQSINKANKKDGCTMITMYNAADTDSVEYGDVTIATDSEKAYTQSYWYRGGWMDPVVTFWNDFSSDSAWNERHYDTVGRFDTCTLVAETELGAGETKKLNFVISWSVPNNYNYWNECRNDDGTHKTWKNYYATVFESTVESALYSLSGWDDLYKRTMLFKDTLHSSTLPECIVEAASANLSVLKSPPYCAWRTAPFTDGKVAAKKPAPVRAPASMYGIMHMRCVFCSRSLSAPSEIWNSATALLQTEEWASEPNCHWAEVYMTTERALTVRWEL
ncbi:MAG: hypothetical protein IJ365_03465, partial [Clostridia bacterium]|nr:hypothetical protein [Clostridia bacterium]